MGKKGKNKRQKLNILIKTSARVVHNKSLWIYINLVWSQYEVWKQLSAALYLYVVAAEPCFTVLGVLGDDEAIP